MKKLIAVLDACVLYPAPIRDFLLNLAARKLFFPKWSEQIHKEWMRSLLAKRPDLNKLQLERTRRLMDEAFPEALVVEYEQTDKKVLLPDPDDHHVLDAAIKSHSNVIVTFNLRDFPEKQLAELDIKAISPDEFIENLMAKSSKEVIKAFKTQVANLNNPPMSDDEILEALKKNGLNKTVNELRKLL